MEIIARWGRLKCCCFPKCFSRNLHQTWYVKMKIMKIITSNLKQYFRVCVPSLSNLYKAALTRLKFHYQIDELVVYHVVMIISTQNDFKLSWVLIQWREENKTVSLDSNRCSSFIFKPEIVIRDWNRHVLRCSLNSLCYCSSHLSQKNNISS